MARRYLDAASSARVALTPLIDIAFLVLIFFMALPLKTLAYKMEAHLPKGDGIQNYDKEPDPVVRLRVRSSPAGTRFELGDQEALHLSSLRPVIRQIGINVIYQVHADSDVMWDDIVEVYDVLKAESCTRLRFRGAPLPDRATRMANPLPPPR